MGIIALGVVKYIIFALLFALSAGKLRFWIFPNLTEDVGFFESFWPMIIPIPGRYVPRPRTLTMRRVTMNLMRTKMNKLKKLQLLWKTRKTRRRTNPSRTILPAKNPQLQEKTLKWWISTKTLMLN